MKSKRIVFILVVVVVAFLHYVVSASHNEAEDDFSEFDDEFEETDFAEKKSSIKSPPPGSKAPDKNEDAATESEPIPEKQRTKIGDDDENDDEVVVEDDDFDGIDDDEFDDEDSTSRRRDMPPPKLTITPVPMPGKGWQAYWSELLVLSGIVVYLINYIFGRYKNQRIAQTFFEINWSLLEENFAVLGDSTKLEDDQGTKSYQKLSDSQFQMWCSGRTCCEGMLVELKLLKRQDLVSILSNIFRPQRDIVRIQVLMGKEDMDSIVFAVANKKSALKISKELNDLVNYCPDKRPGDKFGLNSSLVVMSELGEVATGLLESKTTSVINKYAHLIESIHFTDQFSGLRTEDPEINKDGILKPPEVRRFLFFTFALPTNTGGNNAEDAAEEVKPFLHFVFYTIDRIAKRFRLSREGKQKADKNRAKVEDAFMKQTHAARAEAAAVRREEKRRAEKERILQEDDPIKQRKFEEMELKREKKKKQSKMKQLKVKAL